MEAKTGAVEGEETGVDVNFEMPTRSGMALPVPFLLLHLPAQLVFQLYVELCVLVGVTAVLQNVTPLSYGIKLPDLNISFNRWKSSLTIKGNTKTGRKVR